MGKRGVIHSTAQINTPSILTGAAITANPERSYLHIQNVGDNALRVCFGDTASATVHHIVLKGGTAPGDGLGASFEMANSVYTGEVTFDGTTPKYTVIEM
jgi:hypothetical protein